MPGLPIIPVGPGIGIPGIDIPDIGMPGIGVLERSIIFTLAILVSSFAGSSCCHPPRPSGTALIVATSLSKFK